MDHSFAIMVDSTAEVSSALQKRFEIDEVLRAHIALPNGEDVLSDNDWILFPDPAEFHRQLADKKNTFSTSPCSPEEVKIAVRKYFDKGMDVMFLCLSSGLSGTVDFALMAKKELLAE